MDESDENYANPDAPMLDEVFQPWNLNFAEKIPTVDQREMVDRLAVLDEMCSSEPNELFDFILSDELSSLFSLLVQLLTNIESVDETKEKDFFVGCFRIFAFVIPRTLPGSYLYEMFSNLFVRSLFWMNSELLELSFHGFSTFNCFDNDSSEVIVSAFCENESIPQIIDFILRNSLRYKLQKDVWTFLKNLTFSSKKALILYTPLLCNIIMDTEESHPFIIQNISMMLVTTLDVIGKTNATQLISGPIFTSNTIISFLLSSVKSTLDAHKLSNDKIYEEHLIIYEKLALLLA